MAFDIESLGGGAGAGIVGGIFGAILTAFGINRRVNKMEEGKQDKSSCILIHKSIDDKFDVIIKGQDKIWDRLDSLNDYVRNK